MPRFYFHLLNVDAEEGTELPDLAAAREHAIRNARFTMATRSRKKASWFGGTVSRSRTVLGECWIPSTSASSC